MAELQVIPARHGTATFVPAGQVIKIVNTSGSQVVDTWAFALPKPEEKKDASSQKQTDEAEQKKNDAKPAAPKQTPSKTKNKSMDLPSQEDAEKATQEGVKEGEEASAGATPQKSTWASYVVPTRIWPSSQQQDTKDQKSESEQQKDSRTWASYFPSGQGFSNYIPENARKTAGDTVSGFTSMHARDPNKSYMEQLQDFSRTPVGAAGWSGLAALTGSGWGGSSFAGYQAWNAQNAANAAPMEYMSMTHTHAATLHLRPKVDDTLVSNFREPILTLIEDTSSGIHDTLIAACDPARYKNLGVEDWQGHGSCAENLVLALEELNKRAGLKGAKGVGADVTINSVPAPLNLFMNIPWDDSGEIGFHAPKCKKNDYVRFKAERDCVVVMSACPQDILDINNKNPTDAHFLVEGEEDTAPAIKRASPRKRPPPRKISSSHATSTVGTETNAPTSQRAPLRRTNPPKRTTANTGSSSTPQAAPSQPAKKKPVPASVTPQKTTNAAKQANTAKQANNDNKANATNQTNAADETKEAAAPTPVKKKPRKLNPKPQPAAQSAS